MDAGQHRIDRGAASHGAERVAASITLVLPAFNEQETIEQAIREADEALASLSPDYEILVVDDGSTDDTAAIAEQQAATRPAVRVVRQPRNQGYGAALRRGFQMASKTWVAFSDADCQFDLGELDRLLMLAPGYDIVTGYRIDRQDLPRRIFYSKVYNALTNVLLGTRVRDSDCALKVFRRELVQQEIELESDGFFINAELFTKARLQGKSIVEVGVTHRPRPRGQSTVSLRHAIPVGVSLLRFWWREVLFPQTGGGRTGTAKTWTAGFEVAAVLLLCLASLCLLLPNLSYPLIEPDESRYAQIALEMLQSQDWITPTLHGDPYLDKPPLLYWMTAVGYRVLGVGETAARMPCALSALLTILITYLLGKRLVGQRGAWCGALLLLLCGGFVLCGRFLIMDGPLTLFTTVALLAGYRGLGKSRFAALWCLAAGAACGLGILTKGPVAAVLCIPPLFAAHWLSGRSGPRQTIRWLLALGPVVLLTLPWFVAISTVHQEFRGYFFWKHHVMRFVNAFDHQQPFWFYLPLLLIGLFPASLLLPTLIKFLFGRSPADRQVRTEQLGFLLLAATWTVGFFSASSCKSPTYILPAIPPLCLLLGSMLDRSLLRSQNLAGIAQSLRLFPRSAAITVLTVIAIGAAVDLFWLPDTAWGAGVDVAVAAAAGLTLLVLRRREDLAGPKAWGVVAVLALAGMMFAFDDFVPEIARLRSVHNEAAVLHQQRRQIPVVYFGCDSHAASFHVMPRRVFRLSKDQVDELERFAHDRPETIVVTTPQIAEGVQQSLGSSYELTAASSRGRVYLLKSAETAAQLGSRAAPQLR